jgi:O-6-methylguanine DNA methyltransferase
MDTDRKWVVVRIDGKIAAISTDYAALAAISARLAQQKSPAYRKVTAETVGFEDVWDIRNKAGWNDMVLFGTEFQKKVWKRLFDLTHEEDGSHKPPKMICYSDFAELCQNKAGVRAVAHAIGLNPVAVVIPCHLVVPKETIDRIREIQKKAESTIFKGDDLCINSLLREKGIDFGEYALGRKIKRELIQLEHSQQA